MEKKIGKNTKIVFGVVVAVLVVGGSAFGYTKYTEAKKEEAYELKINEEIKDINKVQAADKVEKSDKERLANLKTIQSELLTYKKGKEKDIRVIKEYEESEAEAIKYFKDQDQRIIADNTIKDLKTSKKADIESKSAKLVLVASTALANKSVTYTSEEYNNLNEQVEKLTNSYDEQLLVIKKAEEKAAADKKAADAKAKADADAKARAAVEAKENEDSNFNSTAEYADGSYDDPNYSESNYIGSSSPSNSGSSDSGSSSNSDSAANNSDSSSLSSGESAEYFLNADGSPAFKSTGNANGEYEDTYLDGTVMGGWTIEPNQLKSIGNFLIKG